MTHTWGRAGASGPRKKSVFGLVWRQSRYTKPKTLESRRGCAAQRLDGNGQGGAKHLSPFPFLRYIHSRVSRIWYERHI